MNGSIGPSGGLSLQLIRDGEIRREFPDPLAWPHRAVTLADVRRFGTPQRGLPDEVNEWRTRNLPNLWRGFRRVLAAKALGIPTHYGQLWLTLIRGDGRGRAGNSSARGTAGGRESA